MAKSIGPEWEIYNLIKYLFTAREMSFIFRKKNTKLLSEQPNILRAKSEPIKLRRSMERY